MTALSPTPTPAASPIKAASATLWLIHSNTCDAAQQARLLSMLSVGETQRYSQFLRPQRQLQFLLGRSLLRHAIAHTASVPAPSIRVTERPGNAPHVEIPAGYGATPYFSLSHSGPFIACLLSPDVAVGLDIEYAQAQRDVLALSQAAFSAEEHAWLLRQHEDLRQAAFYRLWNCKEALYKLSHNQGSATASDRSGWNCQVLPHAQLAICLCSASPLQGIDLIEPASL